MPSLKQIVFVSMLVSALFSTTAAQDSTTAPKTTLTITANATGERVRVTAPSTIVQMHVEVYASSGEKLFDQEIRGGNVFDWHLQDGQAQRLAAGAYVCVVTAKSVNGRLTQKLGTVTVAEKSANVQAGPLQLSPQQAQAIGPVEADSSWTIAGENEPQTPTVIANDGADGQMIRGRGALSFRIGNFFSGIDQEQMRLTEAGDLGIGTSEPQAKLDVAGTIRAQRFLVAKPARLNSQAQPDSSGQTDDSTNSIQPLVSGVGTTSRLTKWADGPSGTLGDSGITETAQGFIGIGTPTPNVKLEVSGDIRVTSGTGSIYFDTKSRLYSDGSYSIMTDLDGNPRYYFAKASGDSGNSYHDLGSNANGAHYFRSALGAANLMVIKNNGNIGIGTANPVSKLDVAGSGDINANEYKIGGTDVLRADGSRGLFVGHKTGSVNNGSDNTFVGDSAGRLNTTGLANSFLGSGSGFSNRSGSFNAFFGFDAGNQIDGDSNSFFGEGTGFNIGSGNDNALFGSAAGGGGTFARTNSGNTLLGARTDSVDGVTNASAIGFQAKVTQSNSLVLGSINGVNTATVDTRVGIGTTAPAKHLHVMGASDQEIAIESSDSGGRQWTLQSSRGTSDGRFEIVDRTAGANRFTILSTGEVGIGTTAPNARLQVRSGDIYVETVNKGIILRTPDGTKCYRVTVDNGGGLTTSQVNPCP